MPPALRIIGFILILCSFLANIPVLFHYTNIYALVLLLSGLFFFLVFTCYTYKFMCIEHYTDTQKTHISVEYVRMIQNKINEKMRIFMLITYLIIFLGSYYFTYYLQDDNQKLSSWQKTMLSYNFTISGFTIMYIYEHENMNKYLSLSNVNVYNVGNELITNNAESVDIIYHSI